ncbi:MAG TPA: hypothetical protein VFN22_01475 [Gemmatimonadales bacterium]|nr:hypothetical protein [Gemmatimonadales bacterium]
MRTRSFPQPLLLACLVTAPLVAQEPAPEWRITNAGVLRADSAIEAVFHARTLQVDTVAIADFASHLLARLGVPPFEDSLAFRVTADSMLVRISGRLMDFPVESRQELGPIFSFIDSTTPFTAEISMPEHAGGIMRFRLERVRVAGFSIPELLLLPALQEYDRRYPVLARGGRELLIAMPPDGEARLIDGGIVVWTNGEKREARSEK